jgi:hypothetical protein
MKRILVLAAVFAAMALPANAQQIVAQSNYVNRNAAQQLPQISITVRADFVLFSVRYSTATRAVDTRDTELTKIFQTVTQRVTQLRRRHRSNLWLILLCDYSTQHYQPPSTSYQHQTRFGQSKCR